MSVIILNKSYLGGFSERSLGGVKLIELGQGPSPNTDVLELAVFFSPALF